MKLESVDMLENEEVREKIKNQLRDLKKLMKSKAKNELVRIIQQMSLDLYFTTKTLNNYIEKYEPNKESEVEQSSDLSKPKEEV